MVSDRPYQARRLLHLTRYGVTVLYQLPPCVWPPDQCRLPALCRRASRSVVLTLRAAMEFQEPYQFEFGELLLRQLSGAVGEVAHGHAGLPQQSSEFC